MINAETARKKVLESIKKSMSFHLDKIGESIVKSSSDGYSSINYKVPSVEFAKAIEDNMMGKGFMFDFDIQKNKGTVEIIISWA